MLNASIPRRKTENDWAVPIARNEPARNTPETRREMRVFCLNRTATNLTRVDTKKMAVKTKSAVEELIPNRLSPYTPPKERTMGSKSE